MFLILYAYFENTPKEYYRNRRIRQNISSYSVIALKTFKRTRKNADFRVVLLYKVVSEYVKSILACTENMFKAYKRIRRIRQEYFAQRWASTLANRSNARHRSNIRAPHALSPQMYESKVWESVWPEGQEAIHS